jgi:predicted TIM-barrel fold metal-dependent hydrolase
MYKGYKVIDFHTHIFPDALAPRALAAVAKNVDYMPLSDETLSGLLRNMDSWGVDVSVALPVLTKQSQTVKTNQWHASVRSGRIIPFGGIYPHTDDYRRDIDFVVSLGLNGIKLHPEYQNFLVDAPEMLPIYDYALSQGLALIFHGGEDPSTGAPYNSSPRQFARVVDAMRGGEIIIAHLGGHNQWEEVERELAGKNVWLDTSMGFQFYGTAQFLRIVDAIGDDRILFATDSPWSSAQTELDILLNLPLPSESIRKITSQNAERLLGKLGIQV